MRKEKIEGIGTIHGGDFESIDIDGIGKLRGNASADSVSVDGMMKLKGTLEVRQLKIDGIMRAFRSIKAKKAVIDGMLKLRRASLTADEIHCDGAIICTNELSADIVDIDGIVSAKLITGDTVMISGHTDKVSIGHNNGSGAGIPAVMITLSRLYFGRHFTLEYSEADTVECTSLEARNLRAGVIRAQRVELREGSYAGKIICDGEVIMDGSSHADNIVTSDGRQPNIKYEESATYGKGVIDMANPNVVKVLDKYKNGDVNADEAENMLCAIMGGAQGGGSSDGAKYDGALPWGEDGKLHIVAFLGRRLLRHGEAGSDKLECKLDGNVCDVDCWGSLSCGNVGGRVNAGSSVSCGNIEGAVSAGSSVNCGDIDGNVSAGSSVTCSNVGGNIAAGGGVHINK